MKIYSYLDSGKAVLTSNLPTHTQVLGHKTAMLSHPHPKAFSKGIVSLVEDPDLRLQSGAAGKIMVQKNHSYSAFFEKLGSMLPTTNVNPKTGELVLARHYQIFDHSQTGLLRLISVVGIKALSPQKLNRLFHN
ncbi:MAG: hypothetical protein QNJ74_05710 [Trichodesmium sp. MO_231.B1]|nr:hypothetical protein [Trichodesmium sp. MO_231.B1]